LGEANAGDTVKGEDRANNQQVVGAGESHTEDHDVTSHVASEDAVEAKVTDRINNAGRELRASINLRWSPAGCTCSRFFISPRKSVLRESLGF